MKPLKEQSVDEITNSILTVWALQFGVDRINAELCKKARKQAERIRARFDGSDKMDEIFDKNARDGMKRWNGESFKRTHNSLHKVIMKSMKDAKELT